MKSADIRKFARKFYKNKDTMHDLSHIDRVLRKAKIIGKTTDHNPVILEAAAYFHGFIYSHEKEVRRFLAKMRVEPSSAERIVRVAWESQKESAPRTQEGKILHDAHVLEGDDFFMITNAWLPVQPKASRLRKLFVT
jgi:uncharacterized protein